ncbi:hypothetical protein [Burkholderia glumae]|uniref:hypothetical protein n=1 Tax=Burkholderia glumae TaxID=337 RepID=UPI00157A49ED|nr:hypothetical protein [Burkholderia glumae]MCQ0031057.1 hypothetical protein [Burkholderia glumae]MCQ0037868.1 hypothetical protein [Burkholderia glumae]MCR1768487.1 hypothetical protein [Burkholderia glumae]
MSSTTRNSFTAIHCRRAPAKIAPRRVPDGTLGRRSQPSIRRAGRAGYSGDQINIEGNGSCDAQARRGRGARPGETAPIRGEQVARLRRKIPSAILKHLF